MDVNLVVVAVSGLFFAGIIKGATGIGYSSCALPFLVASLGLKEAIVLVVAPSHLLTSLSVVTVAVILMIAVFDLQSASDIVHARIPYLYLTYIAVGLAWYALRRRKAQGL